LSIAYELSRLGASVRLLEAKGLVNGSSGACAGRVQVIESDDEAYLSLVMAGLARLAELGEEIGCDLEWQLPGHLTLVKNEQEWADCQKRVARLERAGLEASMLDQITLQPVEPNLNVRPFLGGALSPEGRLNPLKLCFGLARAARLNGVEIHTRTPADGLIKHGERVSGVRTKSGSYSASVVVAAAGAWTGQLLARDGIECPIRFTHAEAAISEPIQPLIRHHVGLAGFYDVVHGKNRSVAFGVGQQANGRLYISNAIQAADQIDRSSTAWGLPAVIQQLRDFFPATSRARIVRTWAAPSPFTPDYRPAIGWLDSGESLFAAAGFHLAFATIPVLSQQAVRVILGEKNLGILEGFRPSRFSGNPQGEAVRDL
jgi:D-hydroxyproline dehydrogenase subunit beta